MAVYNKTFVGTNGVDLTAHDADWVVPTSSFTLEIFGNTATGTDNGGTFNLNYLNQTFASKHYAKGTIPTRQDYHGVAIHCQTTFNAYYAIVASDGTCYAGEIISGTPTDWDAGQTGWLDGDTVELWDDPTTAGTIHLKRTRSAVTTTIQTYTGKTTLTGGMAAVAAVNVQFGSGVSAWEGGDVAAGSPYTLTADQGSYSLTGQAATLKKGSVLTSDQGSYALNGQDATLTYVPAGATFTLTAAQGSYDVIGSNALVDSEVDADTSSYAMTGFAANLGKGYKVTADQGAYVLLGLDGELISSAHGSKIVIADSGTYTLTGQDASLRRAARSIANSGLYNLSGFAVVGGLTPDSSTDGFLKVRSVLVVSTTGRTRWVHYIPVKQVSGSAPGRFDYNGAVEVELLGSGTGLTEWVDYIPVVEVADSDAGKWRYDNSGWIPILIVE